MNNEDRTEMNHLLNSNSNNADCVGGHRVTGEYTSHDNEYVT
jgi:hypothetical protein